MITLLFLIFHTVLIFLYSFHIRTQMAYSRTYVWCVAFCRCSMRVPRATCHFCLHFCLYFCLYIVLQLQFLHSSYSFVLEMLSSIFTRKISVLLQKQPGPVLQGSYCRLLIPSRLGTSTINKLLVSFLASNATSRYQYQYAIISK